jgi:hypothetical protein
MKKRSTIEDQIRRAGERLAQLSDRERLHLQLQGTDPYHERPRTPLTSIQPQSKNEAAVAAASEGRPDAS